MEIPNKSEEELEDVEINSETSEEEILESDDSEDEEEVATVPLSDYTRTKDVLHRIADRVLADPDKLEELEEQDPKLLERLKSEFPKKFKDIKIPDKPVTEEDIEAKIEAAVTKRMETATKSTTIDDFRKETGLTKIEFEDIKDELSEKADHNLKLELAQSYGDAVLLAYKNLSPKKYKELMEKRTVKEMATRKQKAISGSPKAGEARTFTKTVLDNWKKLGFESPEEMVKYQNSGDVLDISSYVRK